MTTPKTTQTRRDTATLPCKLTEDEAKKFAQKLARSCEQIASEESRQKDVKAELKATLEGLEAERTQLAIIVRRGEEERTVAIEETFDYAAGTVTKTRTDTGEQIHTRAMLNEEREQPLFPNED